MSHAALAHPPRWLTASQLHPAPTAAVRDWLFNADSLTRRLTALSANGFSVTPLQESWQRLRNDECSALGVVNGSQGWVREVYLRGHGQPWVFARSVAARSALEGSGLALDQLGQPLAGRTAVQRPRLRPRRTAGMPFTRRSGCQRKPAASACGHAAHALAVEHWACWWPEVFLPEFWVAATIEP